MATYVANTDVQQHKTVEEQIEHVRELFVDAPEVGKKAFENVLKELTSQAYRNRPRLWRARVGPAVVWARFRSSPS
jgi:hypothetical protein